jgi:hypothetical protein
MVTCDTGLSELLPGDMLPSGSINYDSDALKVYKER